MESTTDRFKSLTLGYGGGTQLEQQVKDLSLARTALTQQITEMTRCAARLESDLGKERVKATALEQSKAQLQAKTIALENTQARLESELGRERAKSNAQAIALVALKTRMEESERAVEKYKLQLKDTEAKLAAIQQELVPPPLPGLGPFILVQEAVLASVAPHHHPDIIIDAEIKEDAAAASSSLSDATEEMPATPEPPRSAPTLRGRPRKVVAPPTPQAPLHYTCGQCGREFMSPQARDFHVPTCLLPTPLDAMKEAEDKGEAEGEEEDDEEDVVAIIRPSKRRRLDPQVTSPACVWHEAVKKRDATDPGLNLLAFAEKKSPCTGRVQLYTSPNGDTTLSLCAAHHCRGAGSNRAAMCRVMPPTTYKQIDRSVHQCWRCAAYKSDAIVPSAPAIVGQKRKRDAD